MNCPSEIAAVVLEIIQHGALSARAAGWAGDAARAAREADHIHNLPELLQCFTTDLLEHYWNVQRAGYIAESARSGGNAQGFQDMWERLRPHVAQNEPALARAT